jgi:hypothetical protein
MRHQIPRVLGKFLLGERRHQVEQVLLTYERGQNLLRFELADVRLEQCDVPLDDVDAPLTAGLRDVTRGTISKGRSRTRLSRQIALDSSDFDVESFLSLFLGYRADAQADPNSEISLIDESSAVREDSDAWCACPGYELLL